MKARDVYEVLVGADSAMGVGDFQQALEKFVTEYTDEDGNFSIQNTDAETFLRELADKIATEDEFDLDEEELVEDEDDPAEPDEDEPRGFPGRRDLGEDEDEEL